MLQGVNEEGLRWDFTKGSLEGLQTDDELTSHLAGHTVQCGVDQTKNPTVNSPHLIHSTRRRVDFWTTINTDSTSLVKFRAARESRSRRRRHIFFVRTGPVSTGTDSMPFDNFA